MDSRSECHDTTEAGLPCAGYRCSVSQSRGSQGQPARAAACRGDNRWQCGARKGADCRALVRGCHPRLALPLVGRRHRSQGWPPLCKVAVDGQGQPSPAQGQRRRRREGKGKARVFFC
ncbi:hypothetical protein GW17_00048561 [Ensete ventricosum]|nr:hypothetical protein GW17_00048561 [Ensete ventricosum]